MALALLPTACLGPGGFVPPLSASAAAQREYAAALAHLPEAPEAAIVELEAFLEARPRSRLADDAGVRLAALLEERGEREAAMRRLAWVLRTLPGGDRSDAARLALARLELERGRPEDAGRLLAEVRYSRLSREEAAEAYGLSAAAAGALGDRVTQLRWLAQLRQEVPGGEALVEADARIDALLRSLGDEELERAARELGRRAPAARVVLRRAELALEMGQPEAARASLERAGRLPLSRQEADLLQALEARLDERFTPRPGAASLPGFRDLAGLVAPSTLGASGTLGVVLPLSGRLAALGEECLRGVLLAARMFDADVWERDAAPLRLRVRDSGGTPEGAAAAVRSLAADPAVVAVVGPLLGEESEVAARAAAEAGVPLLALTAREEIAQARAGIFRVGPSPRSAAEVLADYAVNQLGLRRFAILYPSDAYGLGQRALFWDAVESSGGEVVGVATYAPDATDFAQPIRSLVGFVLLSSAEREALVERGRLLDRAKRATRAEAAQLREEAAALTGPGEAPLPPHVDFDALFIADAHEKVELIAPQLAFHDIGGVRLLGPSGWNDPDLIRIAGQHVEGAVFTEGFHADSRFPPVVDFARRYQAAFSATPGPLAALGYDATNLVLVQLARGLTSREDVRRGVLQVALYPGVSGVTSLLPDGNAQKRPYLLGVRGRRIVPLD